MSLAQSEFKNITAAGDAMMECCDNSTFQSTVLQHLHHVIGSESAVYYNIAGKLNDLRFKDGFSIGVPKEAPKQWCEHYRERDPFVNKAIDNIDKGSQSTIVSKNIVVNREYTNTEFYCDFLNPQHVHHVMVIPIVEDARPIALIGLHRPAHSQAFSEKDILKAEFVKPYIKAAIQKISLNTQLDECKSTIDTLISDLPYEGVIVLDTI
ncbi:MAG: GAF domain-containing protein [Gammaproteobacteria bacterium]|nr:GAF domain-containing protein [Gammaproteobacteria bacterium]